MSTRIGAPIDFGGPTVGENTARGVISWLPPPPLPQYHEHVLAVARAALEGGWRARENWELAPGCYPTKASAPPPSDAAAELVEFARGVVDGVYALPANPEAR